MYKGSIDASPLIQAFRSFAAVTVMEAFAVPFLAPLEQLILGKPEFEAL
jgi:hypothetical protein